VDEVEPRRFGALGLLNEIRMWISIGGAVERLDLA
jgi:hypothetical protein